MAATVQPRREGRLDLAGVTLAIVAAGQLLPGALAFLAPGAFYDLIASYPPENGHFIRDLGSWQVPLGLAALVAVRRPSWRAPMLGILALHFALHGISHVIDVDESDPAWHSALALTAQALGFAACGLLFLREQRR